MCAVEMAKLLDGREKPVALIVAFLLLATVAALDYLTG